MEEKNTENLEQQVAEESVQNDIDNTKEQLLRLAADFENYRKRSAEERLALIATANEKMAVDLLTVLDNFERALSHEKNETVQKLQENLEGILAKYGVVKMSSLGKVFDANLHEALATGEGKTDEILEVFSEGYEMGGKVIRHAKVKIGA